MTDLFNTETTDRVIRLLNLAEGIGYMYAKNSIYGEYKFSHIDSHIVTLEPMNYAAESSLKSTNGMNKERFIVMALFNCWNFYDENKVLIHIGKNDGTSYPF